MRLIVLILSLIFTFAAYGQSERKYIRSGNKLYDEKKYADAELSYRKALDKKPKSFESAFNIGNTLYKEGKYMDAVTQFSSLTEATTDKEKLSKVYHNLGNSYIKAQKLNEGIDAYKKALLNNPSDKETKFNLAYAQRLLKQQQQQQQQNKDNKQQDKKNQDKKEDQQKKDQEKKEEQQKKEQEEQQKKEQQEQQKKEQQQKQREKDQQQREKEQQQQQQGKQISKEDAQRMLDAVQNDEKNLQKKLEEQKASGTKVKVLKNW